MIEGITYLDGFVENSYLGVLWNTLDWEQRGAPRREYFCSQVGLPYTYGSGNGVRTYHPRPITPDIAVLWAAAEHTVGVKFELCFLNGYHDEKDHLGWHADDSPEMDDTRPIAVATFGAEREIWFKPQGTKGLENVTKLLLRDRSLCVMPPGFQDTHFHRIPKGSAACGPRVSLTFRGWTNGR